MSTQPAKKKKSSLKKNAQSALGFLKNFDHVQFGVLYTIVSAIIIIVGSFLAIQYAKGNFRFTQQGFAPETGLLNANSFPTGAEVYLDGELVSATDDTLYLEPGSYSVEIRKEGFSPWVKQLEIQQELVTQTNAQLFPIAPSLTPLTFSGVSRVSTSPDGQKVLFYTNTAQNEEKNGLYLLELGANVLPLQRSPRLLVADDGSMDLLAAEYIWHPDSNSVMILGAVKSVLLEMNDKTPLASLPDVSWRQSQILSEWEEEMYLREREFLRKFPEEIVEIATASAKNTYLSPDKKRLLYTAVEARDLPDDIIPPLPAKSTQPQARSLEPGGIYIYDREEDTNFQIGTEAEETNPVMKRLLATDAFAESARNLESSPAAFAELQATSSAQTAQQFSAYHSGLTINTLQWFPDSKHVLFAQDSEVHIMEYDGTNNTVVYSGPFVEGFVYPWPDGSQVLILTTFSLDSTENLYAIEVK